MKIPSLLNIKTPFAKNDDDGNADKTSERRKGKKKKKKKKKKRLRMMFPPALNLGKGGKRNLLRKSSLVPIRFTSKVRHVSRDIVHSGYLFKRAQTGFRRWRMKFFKLTSRRLIYFDDEDERVTLMKRNLPISFDTRVEEIAVADDDNKDEIEGKDDNVATVMQKSGVKFPWQFRVVGGASSDNGGGMAELSAPSAEDRKEWMRKINEVIRLAIKKHKSEGGGAASKSSSRRASVLQRRNSSADKLKMEILCSGYLDVIEEEKKWTRRYTTLAAGEEFVTWKDYAKGVVARRFSVTPDTVVSRSSVGFDDATDGSTSSKKKECLEIRSKSGLHEPVYVSAPSSADTDRWLKALTKSARRAGSVDGSFYSTPELADELDRLNEICRVGHFDVRYAMCYLFKVRNNATLFEDACWRLRKVVMSSFEYVVEEDESEDEVEDDATTQQGRRISHHHHARSSPFDDAFFYLPQLLHLAVNSELHTAALQQFLLSLCLSGGDDVSARQRVAARRISLRMLWLLRGYLEDEHASANHCARLCIAVRRCVEHSGSELPTSVLSRLRSAADDRKLRLTDAEARMVDEILLKNDDGSTKTRDDDVVASKTKSASDKWENLNRQRRFVRALTDASEKLRLAGEVETRRKILPDVVRDLPLPLSTSDCSSDLPIGHTEYPLHGPVDPPLWITAACSKEAHVFSTHARAPLLLVFEGETEPFKEDEESESDEEEDEGKTGNKKDDAIARLTKSLYEQQNTFARAGVALCVSGCVVAVGLGFYFRDAFPNDDGSSNPQHLVIAAISVLPLGVVACMLCIMQRKQRARLDDATSTLNSRKSKKTESAARSGKSRGRNIVKVPSRVVAPPKRDDDDDASSTATKSGAPPERDEARTRENEIAAEGWLTKSGASAFRTTWQRRWIVLSASTRSLVWYADETKAKELNRLSLIGYTCSIASVKNREIEVFHKSGKRRNIRLRCESVSELKRWFQALDKELMTLTRCISMRRSLRMQLTDVSPRKLSIISASGTSFVSGGSSYASSAASSRASSADSARMDEITQTTAREGEKASKSFEKSETSGFYGGKDDDDASSQVSDVSTSSSALLSLPSPLHVAVSSDDTSPKLDGMEKWARGGGELRPPPITADAFGESWVEKSRRVGASKSRAKAKDDDEDGADLPSRWQLISLIAKSYDDLRQEVFAMQLIGHFRRIWSAAHVPVYLREYNIVSTSSSTGLIETITDANSLDGLKKTDGYTTLREHFLKNYGGLNDPRFAAAQLNFLQSLAGYSILSYILQIKDRHNGNILLDNQGHLVHIDFGFLLGIAPGGSFSIEKAPFKLTQEMVDVLDGEGSPLFEQFVDSCVFAMLEAREHAESVFALVEIMMEGSNFPCFANGAGPAALAALRDRFKLELKDHELKDYVHGLASYALRSKGTYLYDVFQKKSNGIMP